MVYSSKSSPRVERKRLQKQDKILDCAMVLVAEGGLEGVTIQAIADAMDLTVGALYRYFPSKSGILGALTRRTLNELAAALMSVTSEEQESIDNLLRIAHMHVEFSRAKPAHFLLISQMMTSPRIVLPPSERQVAMEPAFKLIAFIESQFVAAQAEKQIKDGDARAYALMFWSSIQGALQLDKLARLDPGEMHRDHLPTRIAEDLLATWRVENKPTK